MPPLTLYCNYLSPPGRSVHLLIYELDLPVETKKIIPIQGEHMTPEYLKLNPLHTIPTIVDDGFVLWESRAILSYLAAKYGKDDTLYPKDLRQRAIVDQRLHYGNDIFYLLKSITRSILQKLKTNLTEEEKAKILDAQKNVETLLEGHKFIAGDSLTVADFSYITLLDVFNLYSPMGGRFPNITSWIDRCSKTMKGFEEVHKKGADDLIACINELFPV